MQAVVPNMEMLAGELTGVAGTAGGWFEPTHLFEAPQTPEQQSLGLALQGSGLPSGMQVLHV